MKRLALGVLPVLIALAIAATAQPVMVVNGEADDLLYSAELKIQDTGTGFGDSDMGQPDFANGSELDAAYAVVYDGTLYLVLAGNLESNSNKLEIFFDTRAGGQNQLLGTNPDVDFDGLNRMGYLDEENPGLKFDTGFAADFWISVNLTGDAPGLFASYAELYVDELNPGVGYYLGEGRTRCATNGGALDVDPGGEDPFGILCTIDNSNVDGVSGEPGVQFNGGAGITTGVELAIPLSAIGDPTADFKVCAFVNGTAHNFLSNQVLGGLFGLENLGEPRLVDFSSLSFDQFFTVPFASEPTGACCDGEICVIETAAGCAGDYLGDNTTCEGNPCDLTPAGACCVDGTCSIETQADCDGLGGVYQGDDTNCDYCPCPQLGACCEGETCSITLEDDCSGEFLGEYTTCDGDPCVQGACCVESECSYVSRGACEDMGGRFIGAGVPCEEDTCDFTITTPHVAGSMQGWDASANPMAETGTLGVWELTFTELTPLERYEFKITNGTWDVTLPNSNSWCFASETGEVTITYDGNLYDDGWAPDRDRLILPDYCDPGTWTAVGDFQAQIGSGADWTNNDPLTAMTPTGDPGIYEFEGTGLTPNTYNWKAVITGSWDSISWDGRTINTANMEFVIESEADTVTMGVDALTGVVQVVVVPGTQCLNLADSNCDGSVNAFDIDPFVVALADRTTWEATYSCDYLCANDLDCNGVGERVRHRPVRRLPGQQWLRDVPVVLL